MVTYKIKRDCGDFLAGWDDEFGTLCAGSTAMQFPSYAAASAAARKARRTCKGWNGKNPVRPYPRVNFYPVEA